VKNTYKRLITFGDSFTWGSELPDCIEVPVMDLLQNPDKYSKEFDILRDRKIGPFSETNLKGEIKSIGKSGFSLCTWPALVAKHLELDYHCASRPGCSNQTIVRQITKFLPDLTDSDLIIIDWTYQDRWDYVDVDEHRVENQWKTLRPGSDNNSPIEKFYFTHIQSELWNKWESLRAIMLATYMLKSRNISFFMTSEDTTLLDNSYHSPSYIINAQDEISDYIHWFENKGFYDWSLEKSFPRGTKNNHPLVEAHRAAFEYIINNYEFT